MEKIGLLWLKLRYVTFREIVCKLGFHDLVYKVRKDGSYQHVSKAALIKGGAYACRYCEKNVTL